MYFAYLDEFGHIGPYISRNDPKFKDSPVFGFAGFILPDNQVRNFGTWFYQLKCDLLKFEIDRSGESPTTWEKKGSALYTTKNITQYRELRRATTRILNKIPAMGGNVFYVGNKKSGRLDGKDSKFLYHATLREAMKRLNSYAELKKSYISIVMDEHQEREQIITVASQQMYGKAWRDRILEPPFLVESHRFQTIQCADWLCGLLGRFGAHWANPEEFADYDWAEKYFKTALLRSSHSSGIRVHRSAPAIQSGAQ